MVPQPRPRQPNRYTVIATFVTAYSPPQGQWITVENTEGFHVLDRISIMLDLGENFYATIIQIVGRDLRLTPVLPSTVGGPLFSDSYVGNYGIPIENTVMALSPRFDAYSHLPDGCTAISAPVLAPLAPAWRDDTVAPAVSVPSPPIV